jgi:CIC family chloride channel protein
MRITNASRLIGATLSAGILAGVGAVGFHYLADYLDDVLFTWVDAQKAISRLPFVLIVPTVGLFLIGLFLQKFPASRIGGVREVLESLQHHEGRVPPVRILNVIMSGLVLAVGGSVGPEGPMVEFGALVGSQCGQFFRVTKRQLETLVRAGASAGISAVFRSPAGGVLLTLEIFGARFNRDLTAVAIAAGIGYLVRTSLLGDAYPFRPNVTLDALPAFTMLVVIPVMGALAAFAGHFFISMFNRWKTVFPSQWPLWFRVTLGGAMVGAIGIWFPQVLSSGYSTIRQGVSGEIGFELFVILLLLKMLATSITFGSGAVGGLFAPTLVIGALFGGAFGYGVHSIMPAAIPQPALLVLLGMIVMFGSIVKGYWSGLLMIADLSGCYHQLLLPGVIAGGISYLMSWELHDQSIFGLTVDPSAPAVQSEEKSALTAAG